MIRQAVIALLLAACAPGRDTPPDSAVASSGSTRTASAPTSPATWTLTETGWGPIRPGMSVAEARAALGGQLADPANPECDHVRTLAGPAGLLLMIVRGEVARIEVNDSTIATAAGARVGDTEDRINELYSGRVQASPHKYVDGHYLTVRRGAGSDTVHRLVFETDGRRVIRFRAGRMPEVEWVEGCS